MSQREDISEESIDTELGAYRAFASAVANRKRDGELSKLPNGESAPTHVKLFIGVAWHVMLVSVGRLSRQLGLSQISVWTARKRIQADSMWYEPRACGLNSAWTDLGLALLSQEKHAEAVECLVKSRKVHPCPHSIAYGLRRALMQELLRFPATAHAAREYEVLAGRFIADPHKWRRI